MNPDIAIVAIGYNRSAALKRLLDSLNNAAYPGPVKLYISLDGGGGEEVAALAVEFKWEHGEKEVILHEENRGLRKHVLSCGDLSARHDALIALEDDLVVSPAFYEYAVQSFLFYKDEEKIAGISLYHHAYNETAQFPFLPIVDGSDVYFLKYASSWGQVWGKEHWAKFRRWYDGMDPSVRVSIPANIRLWPKNSWKKIFIRYLIETDLYFVFPRVSLTTIFGDEGTNIRIRETFLQVPLWYGKRPFNFIPFEHSNAVYDTWCEMHPDRLRRLCEGLRGEDFDVDLYGMKFSGDISSLKILSGRNCKNPERNFGREMRPQEENIIHDLPGEYFHLGRKEDFKDTAYLLRLFKCHEKKELAYWYPIREYHFYRKRLLSTGRKPLSPFNPVFLFKKFSTTASYALKYFRK